MCEGERNTKAMISPGHRSGLEPNPTDSDGVSEESVTSLESDRGRSGSLGNVSGSQEWLRWLKGDGGWSAMVAGSAVRAEQELPGVSPESCRESGPA
jgi:hypothetical protein